MRKISALSKSKGRKFSKGAAISVASMLAAVFILTILPAVALALDTGLDYGTFTGLSSQDIRVSIMKIVRVMLGLIGIIATIIIVYAGYLWMTSAGNPEQIDKAKRTLRNAAIGLLIIFFSFAIVSFIIGALEGDLGFGQPPRGSPPGGDCVNCDHLGSGVIESVYPIPGQRDVPRNTDIIVSFKLAIDPTTIIDAGASGCLNPALGDPFTPCSGPLEPGSVLIYINSAGEDEAIDPALVNVSTNDRKTFVFNPLELLGNSDTDTRYAVKLESGIELQNGEPAFKGFGSFFRWRFWVGTFLDIDPPEQDGIFPPPDSQTDDYFLQEAQAATGTLEVRALPQVPQASAVHISRIVPSECEASDANAGTPCDPRSGFYAGECSGGITACGPSDIVPAPQLLVTTGPYNGIYAGVVTLDWNSGLLSASADFEPNRLGFSEPFEFEITSNTIALGNGVILTLVNPLEGQKWQVELVPQIDPDTIRVGDLNSSRTFSFVADSPGASEIAVGSSVEDVARNIAQKIQAGGLPITAAWESTPPGNIVELTAKTAGAAGNNGFVITDSSSSWADPVQMTGGSNLEFSPSPKGVRDQPRNALLRLDFNEVINPVEVPLEIGLPDENRITVEFLGLLCTAGTGGPACSIDADCDTAPGSGDGVCGDNLGDPAQPSHWIRASGVVQSSNLYQTLEIIPEGECLDEDGEPLINSCGNQIFCWPFINPDPYQATLYRVVVKAAPLVDCQGTPSGDSNGVVCGDSNFASCVDNPGGADQRCSTDEFGAEPYPEAKKFDSVAGGVMDIASNSLNGNRNTFSLGQQVLGLAEGPSEQSGWPAFALNKVCQGTTTSCVTSLECGGAACVFTAAEQGDDFTWEFYINRSVDLTPPAVSLTGPNVAGRAISLTLPVQHTFDKVMRSSTLKPGSNYRDGSCLCEDDAGTGQGTCATGQICQIKDGFTQGSCTFEAEPYLCFEDDECRSAGRLGGAQCRNEKYLSLIDVSTSRVGWWVSNKTIDTDSPGDGYGDITRSSINHTRFAPVTEYGNEAGSGLQDIYQNCFLPSQGPDGDANYSRCSLTTTLECKGDVDCPVGERCESPLVQGRCGVGGASPATPTGSLCVSDTDCSGATPSCVEVNLTCLSATNIADGKGYCCNGVALSQTEWEASGGLAAGGCATGF